MVARIDGGGGGIVNRQNIARRGARLSKLSKTRGINNNASFNP